MPGPTPPQNLTAALDSNNPGYVDLSWSRTSPGTFKIYRGSSSGNEDFSNPVATGLTTTTWQDQHPLSGWNYYVATTVSGGQESGHSNEASVQV